MAAGGEHSRRPAEDDKLPDERELIAERAGDLDDLEPEEYLTTEDVADSLGVDLDRG